jgi:endonuclease/exonuclease/phosphatase family metal-dependent hydrolase
VKFLHLNVHMWQDPDGSTNVPAVADLIRRETPDVVSLVEVDEPWGRPDNLRHLADELGYDWAFVPAFEYRNQGGFGNALLSRARMRAVQQWQLLPPGLYDGTEPSEPRAAILAKVEMGGDTVWVGATHLPRQDGDKRATASRRLLELLEAIDPPWVVCGDFNQPPSEWLPSPSTVVPDPTLPTYPSDAPTEHIDYCVLCGASGDARVVPSAVSDHLPLVVMADVDSTGLVSRGRPRE